MIKDGSGSSFASPSPRVSAFCPGAVCALPYFPFLSVVSGSCICFEIDSQTSVLGRHGQLPLELLQNEISSSSMGTLFSGSPVRTKNNRSLPGNSSNTSQRNRSSSAPLDGTSHGM